MSEALIIDLTQSVLQLITLVVTAYVSIRLAKVHKQFNSRMDEMLKDRRTLGQQEGKAQEIADSKQRNK